MRTRVNEIEAVYERPRVNVKVERGSTFTFMRDLPYIVFLSFTHVKITRQWKSTLYHLRRRHQRGRQKSNRVRLARQQLCTCITLFCAFLCRRYTSTTRNVLISRFVEDGNPTRLTPEKSPTYEKLEELEKERWNLKQRESYFWVKFSLRCRHRLTLTPKITTAQVVETLAAVKNYSPIQDYVHPKDHAQPTCTYCLIVLNDVWGA